MKYEFQEEKVRFISQDSLTLEMDVKFDHKPPPFLNRVLFDEKLLSPEGIEEAFGLKAFTTPETPKMSSRQYRLVGRRLITVWLYEEESK